MRPRVPRLFRRPSGPDRRDRRRLVGAWPPRKRRSSRTYGKNNIHYDKFDWHIYTTDHFEIFYYPELEQHLERIAGYAESAYQQISADLKHDLSTKIQLILFKTHSEFEQENIDPSAGQEGVGAFAEPTPPHGDADRLAARSALRPHRARADAPVRVRHHSAGAHSPERPAVGERRAVGVRARSVDAASI